MNAQEEAEAKQRWNKRCNTIRWFKETQARKVVRNGAFPNWFHGMITRRLVVQQQAVLCWGWRAIAMCVYQKVFTFNFLN